MRLSRRSFLTASAATLGVAACGDAGALPLLSADTHPADYPTVQAVQHLADRLREKSGGRLNIRIYSGSQLGSERDTLELTSFGGLDFNRINLAPLNPIAPATLVPSLPFAFRSIPHMRAAMDGSPGKQILATLEPHNLYGLCFYDSGARSFYNRMRPVRTPDDLSGLKIRVQNSDLYVSLVNALGANATPINYSEVYQALLQGVIDGAENNWPSYENSRHYEVAKYYTRTEHVMAPEVLVMSMKAWRRLSDSDQALVMECAAESVPFMRNLWDERVNNAKQTVLASGVELVELEDKSAWRQLVEPVYDQYLTPDLTNILQDIQTMDMA